MKNWLARCVLAAAALYATSASADCTAWMWQEGGWYWQECTDDQGNRHCYHADDDQGTNAYEIPCSS